MHYELKIVLLIFLLFSCKQKEEKNNTKLYPEAKILHIALVNGYYNQINKDIGLSVYQGNIFYINKDLKGFTDATFFMHLINKDGSFENISFVKKNTIVNDSLLDVFSPLEVIKKSINGIEKYEALRTGQFVRKENGTTKNIWVTQFSVRDLLERKQGYNNQFIAEIERNLIQEDFEKELELGRFFKLKTGYFCLITSTNIYIISKKGQLSKDRFMLHFIRTDNSFNNKSFDFAIKKINPFLDMPFKQLEIVKVEYPIEENYTKIRLGQFNATGNIWAQEIIMDEINSNELLVYKGEFNK